MGIMLLDKVFVIDFFVAPSVRQDVVGWDLLFEELADLPIPEIEHPHV